MEIFVKGMIMKTITGVSTAWLGEFAQSNNESVEIENLTFSAADMESCGWVKVGQAEITVHIDDDNAIMKSRIDVLKKAEKKLMADTEVKLNAIRGQIQSLMAIEFQP